MKYTITSDVITVHHNGKPHAVRKDAPNYGVLKTALKAKDWAAAEAALTQVGAVVAWSKGRFTVVDNAYLFDGMPVPTDSFDSGNGFLKTHHHAAESSYSAS